MCTPPRVISYVFLPMSLHIIISFRVVLYGDVPVELSSLIVVRICSFVCSSICPPILSFFVCRSTSVPPYIPPRVLLCVLPRVSLYSPCVLVSLYAILHMSLYASLNCFCATYALQDVDDDGSPIASASSIFFLFYFLKNPV